MTWLGSVTAMGGGLVAMVAPGDLVGVAALITAMSGAVAAAVGIVFKVKENQAKTLADKLDKQYDVLIRIAKHLEHERRVKEGVSTSQSKPVI